MTLLFLTGLFEDLPEATLAAIVIAAVIELVDIAALRRLYRVYTRTLGAIYGIAARPDFIAAVAAMLGVLVFDTLPGLFIGIGVALLLLLYRASRPNVAELGELPTPGEYGDLDRHPEATRLAGVVVLRVESGLFFANADPVRGPDRGSGATARASTPWSSTSESVPVDRRQRRPDAGVGGRRPAARRHRPASGPHRRPGPRRARNRDRRPTADLPHDRRRRPRRLPHRQAGTVARASARRR